MKKYLALLLLAAIPAGAQTLGEFKPDETSYGLSKIKKDANKRIYISGFEVNFQIYNEKEKFKQGGSMLGGGMKGDAKSEVSIGLEGLDEQTVQQITDQLYADYMAKLKGAGMTILTADEAGKTEKYSGFQRMRGGKISMAEIPGVMTATPTNFEYYVKGVDKDGKSKKGGFLGNEASLFPGLSRDLGDAIIGNVDITVLFVSDQNAFQGNGAKIKVKTNLRLVGQETIIMTDDSAIKFKGQNTMTPVSSTVAFYHGKMGAGSTSAYTGTLKKPVSIMGIVDDETITAYAAGGMSSGTPTIYGTFYSVRNGNTSNAKVIKVDPNRYREGVYAAAKKFLEYHTDEFLKNI